MTKREGNGSVISARLLGFVSLAALTARLRTCLLACFLVDSRMPELGSSLLFLYVLGVSLS